MELPQEAAARLQLCPGWVRTSIVNSDRNRENAPKLTENVSRIRERFQDGINTGLEADAVGEIVVDAISNQRFYIHTHPEWMDVVRQRFDAIVDGSRPAAARIPNPKR